MLVLEVWPAEDTVFEGIFD